VALATKSLGTLWLRWSGLVAVDFDSESLSLISGGGLSPCVRCCFIVKVIV
jgi:hypothetical protein